MRKSLHLTTEFLPRKWPAEAFHQHQYDFTGDLELHEAIRARGQA